MYAESIVNERLALASTDLHRPIDYHSPSEVDAFTVHLDSSMRLDSNNKPVFARNLTRAEFEFIENERILCQSDCAYFLTRYCWISDESTNIVRFRFRGAQPIFFAVISELEAQHAAIELLVGKARQQYITTLTQLIVLHRVLFHHYTYGVIASADASKSAEMAEKAFFTYDHLPWWLKPKYSRRTEGVPGLLKFETMESRISILHGSTSAKVKGGQRTGIARGSTPTCYAISECAHFPDAEQTIEAALFGGVHANPKTFGVLESTFAGDKDWFARTYKSSKANYATGMSRLMALFFNWPFAKEIYPTPTWWRTNQHHVPRNWEPEGKVKEQILKAELFIRSSPLLHKHMREMDGTPWSMPLEQRWYYNFRYTQAEANGTLGTLQQELSCDDVEAMISSFDNVFGREVIEVISQNREKDFDVYGFAGKAIAEEFEPDADEIDYDKPRIMFNHKIPDGEVYRWELIPLKYNLFQGLTGADRERPLVDNKLFVYRRPEPYRIYGIGGDSSTGNGHDASVLSVNLCGLEGLPDIQAAEFRSHHVGHVDLYAFAMVIALYYRDRGMEHGSPRAWPMIAAEQIASVGDVFHRELRKLGYPVSRMHHFTRMDGVDLNPKGNKIGWFTGSWSRPILLGDYIHDVKTGWYIINSPFTIEECRQFEIHTTDGGKEKQEHGSGSWDDGIFSSAISSFIVHTRDSRAARSKKQYPGPEAQHILPPVDIDPWLGNSYNPNTKVLTMDQVLNTLSSERHRQ